MLRRGAFVQQARVLRIVQEIIVLFFLRVYGKGSTEVRVEAGKRVATASVNSVEAFHTEPRAELVFSCEGEGLDVGV